MTLITRDNAAQFRRPLYRPDPVGPPQAYKTYSMARRADTLIKTVCEKVGCPAWRSGWETPIAEYTDLGARQAAFIRLHSGRTFREYRSNGMTVFRFEPRQRCFTDHRTYPVAYAVQWGDWRQRIGTRRVHSSPGAWIDDFASHQYRLAKERS